MKPKLESALASVLTMATVVIAIVLVRREFAEPTVQTDVQASRLEVEVEGEWDRILALSRTGPISDSSIVILQFGDFECPFCKRFHEAAHAVQHEGTPDRIVLGMAPFPLGQHRFAKAAAVAAECAAEAGAFDSFSNVLFASQDSIGLLSWSTLASRAGIGDTASLQRCIASGRFVARVDASVALGRELGVRGTPTVIVNGWRFSHAPSETQLRTAIDRLQRGESLASTAFVDW